LILELKGRYPDWGPLKIKQYLFRHEQILLPTTRIYKFLKSRGLVQERSVVELEGAKARSFEYPYPLAAVQMDVLDLTLSSGTTIHLMTLLDDFSRFVLGCRFAPVKTMEEAMGALRESVRVYGLMEKLLTDLGSEFVSWQSFTAFEQLLCDWDVEHIQSGPRNPQTQGKAERWHQTVREALAERGPLDYSSEAQLWIRQVVDVYNYERPHQALGGLVPADRFFGLKEELEAELERYRSGERQGQRIYFACRVGGQKVVVSGPRADRLSVLVDGQRLGMEAGKSARLKPVSADASSAILPSIPVGQDRQLEEETHSAGKSADDCR
jgi:transposase InsO family protein